MAIDRAQRRGRDSNPRTRLPPLRDFQSRPFNRSGTSPESGSTEGYDTHVRTASLATQSSLRPSLRSTPPPAVARLQPMVLAMSKALSTDIGLIATFGGIGVIVNIIIVYIAVQIRGERQQNQEYREQMLDS